MKEGRFKAGRSKGRKFRERLRKHNWRDAGLWGRGTDEEGAILRVN
jgi:hypothetical protein